MKNKIKLYFADLTNKTRYEFLEEGSSKGDLEFVARKSRLKLPSQDLAIFKGRFALIDEFNRNGCRLSNEEVENALDTIIGKAIDFDHERKNTCGHWLDAHIEGNEIISYGAFWKSNFKDEYEDIKARMTEGKVKISMEAWGVKEEVEKGKYDLTNIEFAGGALLSKDVAPAEPTAEVLEMSKKRVLEFATVINKEETENAKKIECQCIECNKIVMIDGHCKDHKCPECNGTLRRKDRPGNGQPTKSQEGGKQMSKEKKDTEKVEIKKTDEELKAEEAKKVKDAEEAKKAEEAKVTKETLEADEKAKKEKEEAEAKVKDEKKEEAIKEKAEDKVTEKADSKTSTEVKTKIVETTKEVNGKFINEIKVDKDAVTIYSVDGEKQFKEEYKIKEVRVFTQSDIEAKDAEIAKLSEDLEKANKDLDDVKKEIPKEVEKAKEIEKRRNSLGEFAKDLSDEDILDELKYENAGLKKEVADLKAKKTKKQPEEASEEENEALETGKKNKENEDWKAKQIKMIESAYPEKKKKK